MVNTSIQQHDQESSKQDKKDHIEEIDEDLVEQMCNLWVVNNQVIIEDKNEDLENLK